MRWILTSSIFVLGCSSAVLRPDAGPNDGGTSDAGVAGPSWRTEEIGRGMAQAVAIGPDGTVHVTYGTYPGDGQGEIWYSRSTPAGWESSLVDSGPRVNAAGHAFA